MKLLLTKIQQWLWSYLSKLISIVTKWNINVNICWKGISWIFILEWIPLWKLTRSVCKLSWVLEDSSSIQREIVKKITFKTIFHQWWVTYSQYSLLLKLPMIQTGNPTHFLTAKFIKICPSSNILTFYTSPITPIV